MLIDTEEGKLREGVTDTGIRFYLYILGSSMILAAEIAILGLASWTYLARRESKYPSPSYLKEIAKK